MYNSYSRQMQAVFALASRRLLHQSFEGSVAPPVITVPEYMKSNLKKVRKKIAQQKSNEGQYQRQFMRRDARTVVISCKHPQLNHYLGQTYRKFQPVSLASQGWAHRKSRGDHFTIHAYNENPAVSEATAQDFEDLGLNHSIVESLKKNGIDYPTVVQSEAIPVMLRGDNTLIASETGGGKTFAYLLPIIQDIMCAKTDEKLSSEVPMNSPQAVIITPGRELTEQIYHVARKITTDLDISAKVVIGGSMKNKLLNPSVKPVDILIGSFGILSKMCTHKLYTMAHVENLVLDEADTLLDDTFNAKIRYFLNKYFIYSGLNKTRLCLVGATMPHSLDDILEGIIPLSAFTKVATPGLHTVMPHVQQHFLRLSPSQKAEELLSLVRKDISKGHRVMIFSNDSPTCDWVAMFLNENGVQCVSYNAAMSRKLRAIFFKKVRQEEVPVISCTDIASRGLDTTNIQHVINFQFPTNLSDYIHRCGRTGRVGSLTEGRVTNFICAPWDAELVQQIELCVRNGAALPNVNANVAQLLGTYREQKHGKLYEPEYIKQKASRSRHKSHGVNYQE